MAIATAILHGRISWRLTPCRGDSQSDVVAEDELPPTQDENKGPSLLY
jgi:hypothetical protein